MSAPPAHHDDDLVEVTVKVPRATLAWLCEVADLHHSTPELTAGAVLRDVAQDDQAAHEEQLPSNVFYLN